MKRIIKEVVIVIVAAFVLFTSKSIVEHYDLLGYTSLTFEMLVKYVAGVMILRYFIILVIYQFKKTDTGSINLNPKISLKVTDNNRSIIIAVIVVIGLIISTIIYAFSSRYVISENVRVDKWTGEFEFLEEK